MEQSFLNIIGSPNVNALQTPLSKHQKMSRSPDLINRQFISYKGKSALKYHDNNSQQAYSNGQQNSQMGNNGANYNNIQGAQVQGQSTLSEYSTLKDNSMISTTHQSNFLLNNSTGNYPNQTQALNQTLYNIKANQLKNHSLGREINRQKLRNDIYKITQTNNHELQHKRNFTNNENQVSNVRKQKSNRRNIHIDNTKDFNPLSVISSQIQTINPLQQKQLVNQTQTEIKISENSQDNKESGQINKQNAQLNSSIISKQKPLILKKKTIIKQGSLDENHHTFQTVNQSENDSRLENQFSNKNPYIREKISLMSHSEFENNVAIGSVKKQSIQQQSNDSGSGNYFFPEVNTKNQQRYDILQNLDGLKLHQQDSGKKNGSFHKNSSFNNDIVVQQSNLNMQQINAVGKTFLFPQNNGANSPSSYVTNNDDSIVINKSGFESNHANLTTNASITSNNIYEFNKSPYVFKNKTITKRDLLIQYERSKFQTNLQADNPNILSINQSSNLSNESNASPSLQATRTALLKLKESSSMVNNQDNNQQIGSHLYQIVNNNNNNGSLQNSQFNSANLNGTFHKDQNHQQHLIGLQQYNQQILPSSLKILEKYKFKMPQNKQIQQYFDSQKSVGQMMGSPNIRKKSSSNINQISSIANFLDETLSKLKSRKPNQRNLKPLDNQVLLRFQQQLASQMRNFQNKNRDTSPDDHYNSTEQISNTLNTSKVLDLSNEINYEDLTEENRFYLIQQLENIQQNIRYQLDGSPYIFQDFEDGDDQQYADGYLEETEISQSPTASSKDHLYDNFSSKILHREQVVQQQKHQREIIKEEEDEEDKESVVQLGDAQDTKNILFSHETFDLRSPMQKKNKLIEQNEKFMPNNIQSQSELRKILNERKVKKSISLLDLNDEEDEINIDVGVEDQNQMASKLNIVDNTATTSTLPRYDILNLKHVIAEPDDMRSRNNHIPLFTESQQSRVVITTNKYNKDLNRNKEQPSKLLNLNYTHSNIQNTINNYQGAQRKVQAINLYQIGRQSPLGQRNPLRGRIISEEQESQVLFQSKNLNTYEKSPRLSKIYHQNQQDDVKIQ